MPTYAYACTACDHAFDVIQSFSDDPLTVCPECEGRLRKVYNSIGVTFKGSGFYRTDSRSGAKSSSGGSSSSSDASSSSASGDTKSAPTGKDSGASASSAPAPTSSSSTASS